MNLALRVIESWVKTPVADALGWTLVHTFWEGAVIAGALGLLMLAVSSPRVRYASGCGALVALLISFAVTLWHFWPPLPGTQALLNLAVPKPSTLTAAGAVSRSLTFGEALAFVAPWLAPFWLAGVFAFSLRSSLGWFRVRSLRRRGVCTAPPPWQRKLSLLANELRVSRPVQLLESALADTPMVLGHLRPTVLVPLGFLAGLPVEQVEAILLHELEHIRRADYLVNALQRMVESLLFYNPATWFISRVIRTERENCCDDAVVAVRGNAHAYAGALAALEQNRIERVWTGTEPAMAASGGNLMKRVQRLLYPHRSNVLRMPGSAAALLIAAGVFTLAAWQGNARAVAQTPSPDSWSKWLHEDVAYIIEPQEKAAFESLSTDEERQHFADQFWERRDPNPGSPQNSFKEEHYRRIAYVNDRYRGAKPGWQTARGRIYIQAGPPDEIDSHPSGDKTHSTPWESWGYRRFKGFVDADRQAYVQGDRVEFKFVYDQRSNDFDLQAVDGMSLDMQSSTQNTPVALKPPADSWSGWLNEDVVYLISPQEKAAFESLQTDDERRQFIQQFWVRRNPNPGSSVNAYKEEHYRRLNYAYRWSNGRPGWQTDRGRIYIQYGPPDEIDSHSKGNGTIPSPYEEWLYRHIVTADGTMNTSAVLSEGKKPEAYGAALFTFVDKTSSKDYTLENTVLVGKQ